MYGITGQTLKVISDFLLERSFRVRIDETLSDIFSVGTTALPDITKVPSYLLKVFQTR